MGLGQKNILFTDLFPLTHFPNNLKIERISVDPILCDPIDNSDFSLSTIVSIMVVLDAIQLINLISELGQQQNCNYYTSVIGIYNNYLSIKFSFILYLPSHYDVQNTTERLINIFKNVFTENNNKRAIILKLKTNSELLQTIGQIDQLYC